MDRLPFTAPAHLEAAVAAVRQALATHGLVALPTETFYGLAVDPLDGEAVARVFAAKGRPADKRLLVVAASLVQLEELVVVAEPWRTRLATVWPAPLTVVLPSRRDTPAGGATLAVRVPAHPLLRALLARVGPLTATSANRSGAGAPALPEDVAAGLGADLAVLLDGGPSATSIGTTLLDVAGATPRVLRRGAFRVPTAWGVTIV